MKKNFPYERFQRQLILKDFGEEAQQKLLNAKVLIIGAGGLGCPALQYLAAIGVGNIGIVDGDRVSMSNLHRQILFDVNDIGKLKTEAVKEKIHLQNDMTVVSIYSNEINQSNAFEIIKKYDVLLDCTDNFIARYLINDACIILNKPLVFGAVFQYEGQLSVFNYEQAVINYRDLFPVSPNAADAPNCAENGVFNIVTGIIGTMQAGEAVKIITGLGEVLSNKLLTYNALRSSFYTIDILENKSMYLNAPTNENEFNVFNYDQFCGLNKDELTAEEFDLLVHQKNVQLIDIRNEDELPKISELNALQIPLTILKNNIHQLDKEKKIILFCHSGIRTQTALDILHDEFQMNNVSHLKGGIIKWLDYKATK